MIKCLVTALLVVGLTPKVSAGQVFGAASYTSNLTLQAAASGDVGTGVAFSNNFYYTGYGENGKSPFAELDAAGNLITSVRPYPGITFRSLFTNAAGDVFVRGYNQKVIWIQGTFGTFKAVVQLAGVIDGNSQIVLDSAGTHYVGNNDGTLMFWDLTGALTKTVMLAAGAANGVISVFGNYALSYNLQGLHAYSLDTGALVDTTQLTGADPGLYGVNYGQSYASNGYFFVPSQDGSFKGFKIGPPPSAVPEPATWALLIIGFAGVGAAVRRRRAVLIA